jgi:signal transduction histidine kinase
MFKQISLRVKFAALFIVVALVLLVGNFFWRSHTLQMQAEHEMLQTTQVLAEEMDAIWDFMEINQGQFVRYEDGTYNLYCVVAAKAVSRIFTTNNVDDFIIHYTNLTTRKPDDTPDEFEVKALEALHADPGLESYYSLEANEDTSMVFRYVEPLYITDSCLECHGEPKGALDIMGYPKEGLEEGDIAGAVSIIMPADTYMRNINSSLLQESLLFILLILAGLTVIFFSIAKLVTSPMKRLEGAARQIEQHDFDVDLKGVGDRDEMQDLAAHFHSMAEQLQDLYDELGTEVDTRTLQLEQTNHVLEEQRRELEAVNIRLAKENRYKSDFLAIMSHEIRTPLTSILAFADIWARSNTPRNAEEESIMKEMRLNSQILLAMVNNILEMARVEAGYAALTLEPVEISDLLAVVRSSMGFLAEKKQVRIKVDIARDVPVVFIDSEKVRRILENLISNAIKFVDERGVVEVRVWYDCKLGELILLVADNGCGIGKEDRPFIFERFVQGRDPDKYRPGGSGLGLAVVRELAELHGGSVKLVEDENLVEDESEVPRLVEGENETPRADTDSDTRIRRARDDAERSGCTFVVRLVAGSSEEGE